MPDDDLSLAIRIRADVQQALVEMGKMNDRLGEAGARGRRATFSLEGLRRAALEAADAHEALGERAQAAHDATAESARAALAQVRRDSDAAAEETQAVTVGAFRSMEHAIARFATTGKLSFSGLVDSVIADLARLAARRAIVRPLAGLIAGALPGLFGGSPAGGDAAQAAQAAASRGAGVRRGIDPPSPRQGRSIAPPAIFDGAPRFHSGGIAGLRPEEIPAIVRRGEAIFTPEQVRALGQPRVTVQIENRGTPQREVGRTLRLDPTGLVVAIVTDDLMKNGPIRRTMRHTLGVGEAIL